MKPERNNKSYWKLTYIWQISNASLMAKGITTHI